MRLQKGARFLMPLVFLDAWCLASFFSLNSSALILPGSSSFFFLFSLLPSLFSCLFLLLSFLFLFLFLVLFRFNLSLTRVCLVLAHLFVRLNALSFTLVVSYLKLVCILFPCQT